MEILNISAEALETMFQDDATPQSTQSTQTPVDNSQQIQDTNILMPTDGFSSIPTMDIDELEASAAEEDDKSSDDNKDSSTKTSTTKEKDVPANEDVKANIPTILKNTVDYLIKEGIWQDFEGREDLEVDEATYAELTTKQVESKVNEMFTELLDSTGDYGKAIIEHIKEGGNPDTIIDIFKEQKQLESINTDTEQGKVQLIGQYYSDVLGWKPERIKKHLQRIIADEDLETESSEIQEKYNEHYQEQLAQIEQEREANKIAQIENQKRFVSNIQDVLKETSYTEKEKKLIESGLFTPRKLPNGQVATDFNIKFAEIQRDPKKLVDLVYYIMDNDSYKKKINSQADTKAAVKSFEFIKGNAATTKNKGSQSVQKDDLKASLDFSSLLK